MNTKGGQVIFESLQESHPAMICKVF